MLNELRDLSRSLIASGIELTNWHPNFDKCPRGGTACFIYLDESGDIKNIILPEPNFDVTTIRKWEKANGCSFPAFNVPSLFIPNDDEVSKKINQVKKILQKGQPVDSAKINELIGNCSMNWDKNTLLKINLCLSRAVTEVEEQLGDIPIKYSSIQKLFERAKNLDTKNFHQKLKLQIIQRCSESMKLSLLDMLFQTGTTAKKFQVICDIDDWSAIGASYPANHPVVQKWLNDRFMHFSDTRRTAVDIEKDAFNDSAIGWEEKLPSVRMSILGNVILRAMSSESPCQGRYGMVNAISFPVGANARREMKGALEWLSDDVRKAKTWIDLTKKIDNSSILFSYPTKKPETAPELAGLMGGGDDNIADPEGATFSAIAARVTQTLRGLSSGSTDNDVRIFVLAKRPGDARTKVVASRYYTTEHTIKSAEQWQAGCRNIPNLQIRQFENAAPVWKKCLIPFPTEVVWCLNTAWRRQGTYAERVHGFSINEALSLLLDEGTEVRRLSLRAIDAIVRNCSPLLLAIGQENASGMVFRINKKYEKQALLLPSILGLLLYKNGIEKGGFMNSVAYLVGRFLSLADDLHLKYCQYVRKGAAPPQLVGNALMPTALETPEKALSMLSQRILPYQAWAKIVKEGNDIGLVKYLLGQLGEVSDKLKDLNIPAQCTDADKAQILLGYLARPEKTND